MWLDLSAVHAALSTETIGRRVVYLTSTGSTMDDARREADDGAVDGTLVFAEEQSSGRGRFGRRWVSPAGKNLYFTLLLRPSIEKLRTLGIVAPLAVSRAVEEVTRLHAGIKWPNDVQVAGKKLAGILVESELAGADVRYALVGIGVNVNYRIHGSEIVNVATSLSQETSAQVSREVLLTSLLNWFEALYEGDPSATHADWKARLNTLGQAITVSFQSETHEGVAEDVDNRGNLLLRKADGSLLTLEAGEVSLRA